MAVAMPKFKKMQKLVDNVNLVSREILTGLSVIRAFGREKKEEERFDKANKELTKTMLFTNRVMTFMMPVMMLIMNCLSVGIVWVAAHRIDSGVMQVGSMISIYYLCNADSYVIPYAYYDVNYASKSYCCC